ncbi:MAG: type I DNA topoisomerase [Candidatus Sumerlaeaceae bacterium]|nr:type I DNA topoisomerase [Candidatus Sumerlaeaceae bacterium]
MKKLVIVESPAKAKTIEKFLGSDYKVVASYGHIRDLPGSAEEIPEDIKSEPWARMAVNTASDFTPYYVVPADKKKRVDELKKQIKDATEILLATDEDREGESISWHLLEVLSPRIPVRRITFNEITKEAIDEAVQNPRDVDDKLVRSQEGRRILDRLFGYQLSPVLWKKVRTGLSAGRVQSVALRLVVEREEERMAFHKAGYWDAEAKLAGDGKEFTATMTAVGGKKLATGKDFDSTTGHLKADADVLALTEAEAHAAVQRALAGQPWRVANVEQKDATQRPPVPLTTSTLQQAASGQLGMSPRRTMTIAQKLYEGVDLGHGEREGLITYMRTDSLTLSEKALEEAGRFIKKEFGEQYYEGPKRYKTKSKAAQEAHEAIRPTHLLKTPQSVAHALSEDELALYELIWRRTMASQMPDARLTRTGADIEAADTVFRATGSVVKFPGYLKVLSGGQKDVVLPALESGQLIGPGQAVTIVSVTPERHETQPPARYTEASLIKKLEEEGVGRPSTYATIVTTIQQRQYVTKKGNALVPTFVGMAVTSLLRGHFQEYVDVKFTARMEDALDDIAAGGLDWVDFLSAFYRGGGQFGHGLEHTIKEELPKIEFPAIDLGADPASGEPLRVRVGKMSAFVQRGAGGDGNTATIPPEVMPDELTAEKALEILAAKGQGKVVLGQHPDTNENIYLIEGPLGPYVQLGEGEKKKKPKRSGLPKGLERDQVTLEKALELLSLPRELGKHPDSGEVIASSLGRFGPYVVCNGEYRSLEATDDVLTITLDRALELFAKPKGRRAVAAKKSLKELGNHPESGNAILVLDGRYGPYVSDGKVNATIPRGTDPLQVSLPQAVELLADAAARGKGKTKGRTTRTAKAASPKKTASPKKAAAPRKTTRKSAKSAT